jgi:hypothetical protein
MRITVCDICGTKEGLTKKKYGEEVRYYNGVITHAFDLCLKCELKAKNRFIHKLLKNGSLNRNDYNDGMVKNIEELKEKIGITS